MRVEAVVRVWTSKLRKEIRVIWWVKRHWHKGSQLQKAGPGLGVATALEADANEIKHNVMNSLVGKSHWDEYPYR